MTNHCRPAVNRRRQYPRSYLRRDPPEEQDAAGNYPQAGTDRPEHQRPDEIRAGKALIGSGKSDGRKAGTQIEIEKCLTAFTFIHHPAYGS